VATVDHRLKLTLEHLLAMSGGYVLDFSNATFADFVQSSIGIDPYTLYGGSKRRCCGSCGLTSLTSWSPS
jgi:hypothetical protein